MNVWQQTRRAATATLGAADWVQEQLGRAWEDRRHWGERIDDAYGELTRRGEDILSRSEREGRRQTRKAREYARRVPGVAPAEGEIAGMASDPEQLPISDYDTLSAEQLVRQLPTLSQRELHKIEGYETNHQARATVLRRIEELRGGEPWPAYDEMTVDEIVPRLRELSANEQSTVADYERRHKQRRTVLDAVGRDGAAT